MNRQPIPRDIKLSWRITVTSIRLLSELIICVLTFSACSSKPDVVQSVPEINPVLGHTVYVVNHGWHTGIILPSYRFKTLLPFLHNRFDDVPYYEFGWGDQNFYQAEEVTTGLTLKSLLLPTRSVVHVVAVKNHPVIFYRGAELYAVSLSESELTALQSFIGQSFHRNPSGNIIMQQRGLYADSQFYTGTGEYHLFNTCNTWTAKGLQSAGLDISPTFKLTAGSVISFLKGRIQDRTVIPGPSKR